MHNTPASRTSRHGSSKKQRRSKRSQSRPATPATASVLPELIEQPMDSPSETKEEAVLRNESDGALDIVLGAQISEQGDVAAEDLQTVEGIDNSTIGWLPEPLASPQPLLEDLSSSISNSQLDTPSDIQRLAIDSAAHDAILIHEETEHLQQASSFHDEAVTEEATSEPVKRIPTPDQVNEDLLLSVNFGPEKAAVEDYRTVDSATSPVRTRRDDVDKADVERRLGEEVEFPPASESSNAGHVRAPIVTRRQTNMSTLSRQLKNVQSYLPASPQLPAFGLSNLSLTSFSAPGISNVTVNASGFNRPSMNTGDSFASAKDGRRRSTGMFSDHSRPNKTSTAANYDNSDGGDLSPTSPSTPQRRHGIPTASLQQRDKIEFATFQYLHLDSISRRLLVIGYENGLQIWDTTNLGEVQELFNRRISGAVIHCGILPTPRTHSSDRLPDMFSERRPLIGIVIEERDTTYLSVYSLATHEVVKKLDFSGDYVTSFQASTSFIVVSTAYLPSLHILNSRNLNILYTIQERKLMLFSRPMPQHNQQITNESTYLSRQDEPHAVFSLSNRLLAFAATPPTIAQSSLESRDNPRTAVPQSPSIQIGPLNVSQADIGNAALKVGGGLLSGMRALGGFAAAAARGESISSVYPERPAGFRSLFSRSAPSEIPRHDRRYSEHSELSGSRRAGDRDLGTPSITTLGARIVHVTVLDLQSILHGEQNAKAECLANFALPAGYSVSGLEFSEDGQSLSVIPADGSVVRMYQIRPKPASLRSDPSRNSKGTHSSIISPNTFVHQAASGVEDGLEKSMITDEDETDNEPWHVYDLRRGRTNGIIEGLKGSTDSRWVALSTRKRTIHVFATNPYWGKPDHGSHLEGRVRNTSTLQPLATELHPITRLRFSYVTLPDHLTVPLAYSFIASSPNSLPAKYLPPPSSFPTPQSIPSSLPSSSPIRTRRQSSPSPRLPSRPTNYQDVVVFDPLDGRLSLHRITLSVSSNEGNTSILSSLPLPSGTSMSLPGMSFMRSSSSPSKSFTPPSQAVQRLEMTSELMASTSTIVNWDLMRKKNWKEVNVSIQSPSRGRSVSRQSKQVKSEWLSQSELSTSSRSPQILPTSVYLSHQFSFFAFGEDYHALLRRLHFDIPVNKFEVRREVEASPYSSGQGEFFVSGSSPQEIRSAHPAFDAPLASAISATLDYSGKSPPVIPMLPNGGRPGSFKASIPIRSVAAGLTEGMNESLGRLRREMKRVRSPRLRPQVEDRTPGPVPLEFDEDDEIFAGQMERESGGHDSDVQSVGTSRGDSGGSVSTPSTNNNAPLPDGELEGWSLDDMDGLDEEERFDEISPAGFMDEEQRNAPIRIPGQKKASFGRKGR